MTVAAKQSKIADGRGAFAGLMQWLHVVAFDEAQAPITVGSPEVKAARFARERLTARLDAADLLLAQRGLPLPYSVQAQQVSALKNTFVLIADKLRDVPSSSRSAARRRLCA
jgi:hypothetical protein